MKKINYLEIIKRAFLLSWRNKFLWVFGFFIFLGSMGSNSDVIFRQLAIDENNQNTQVFFDFAQKDPGLFMVIGLLLLIFGIMVFLLKIVSVTAVIKSANNIKLYSQLPLLKIFNESRKYLWKLLLLGILIGLSLFAIAILLIIPIFYLFIIKAQLFGFMMTFLAFVIFVPLVVLGVYLNKYAYLFLILGDFGIRTSLELAYVTLAKNIKESLIMGVISLGLGMLVMILTMVVGVFIFGLVGTLGFLANMLFAKIGMIVVGTIGGIFGGIVLVSLLSWYAVFMQTTWLLFFQEISFEKDKEKKKTMERVEAGMEVSDPGVV
ncbi:MAG: hypothetical protein ACD_8C00131G0001 [uncultured bacterium]|nr:MAG: hypothetical protein ACD_8C00131G0001 [uncultured bacterium]